MIINTLWQMNLCDIAKEGSYDKFTDIGEKAWTVFNTALKLPMNKRIYILSHVKPIIWQNQNQNHWQNA